MLENYGSSYTGAQIDSLLGKAGTALQANQGSGNAGKFLIVGSDGTVTPTAISVWQGGSY